MHIERRGRSQGLVKAKVEGKGWRDDTVAASNIVNGLGTMPPSSQAGTDCIDSAWRKEGWMDD